MTHRLRAAALFLLLPLALPAATWALPTVFVEPVSLYNTPDLDSMAQGLRSMLASRVAGDGYEVRTDGDPPKGAGDWLIRTSITRLGATYSLDASLVTVGGILDGTRTYETTDNPDDLIPALGRVAARLRQELERPENRVARTAPALVPVPVPVTVPTPVAAPAPIPAPVVLPVPPQPVAQPVTQPVAQPVAQPAPTAVTDLQGALERQRTGPVIPGEGLSLVVTDADADGNLEVVVLTKDSIVAFRDHGGELVQAWESPVPQQFTPTTLTAGDLDGNGISELFVAGILDHSPITQAVEWFGSALAPKGERTWAFLRAISHPDQGVLLLGMAPGTNNDLFDFGMRRYLWDGASYREKGKYPVTDRAVGVNLDFLRLGPKDQLFTVITTQGDVVQGLDPQENTVFEIDDKVKGTRVKLIGAEHTQGYQDEDIVQISARTVGYRSPQGEDYLLLHKNSGGTGRLFERVTGFSSGRLLAYRWGDLGLSNTAQSQKYSGYIADIGLAPATGTKGATLFAALVQSKAGFTTTRTTRVVAYDLP